MDDMHGRRERQLASTRNFGTQGRVARYDVAPVGELLPSGLYSRVDAVQRGGKRLIDLDIDAQGRVLRVQGRQPRAQALCGGVRDPDIERGYAGDPRKLRTERRDERYVSADPASPG